MATETNNSTGEEDNTPTITVIKNRNSPSSVGIKYTRSSDGTNIQAAATAEKVKILAKKNPNVGQYVGNLFGVGLNGAESAAGAINNQQRSLDAYTRNVIQTLFAVELYNEKAVNKITKTTTSAISSISFEITHDIQGLKTNIRNTLKPISSATGATLGTLTSVAKNPLGAPSILGNALVSLVDKMNPGFADKVEATYKKYKTDELRNLPGQIFGSIRSLAATADAILTFPFVLASDIYNGLLQIMSEISSLLDNLLASVVDLVFGPDGILDSIIPFSEIREFLDAVDALSSSISFVSQYFGGFAKLDKVNTVIQTQSSYYSSLMRNPVRLAMDYVPTQITSTLDMIRNPEDIVDSLIPKSVQEQFQQIGKLPGLGFVGNLGYSFGGTLTTLSEGVFTKTIRDFEEQAGVLSPLYNVVPKALPVNANQQPTPPTIKGSTANSTIEVAADETPIARTPPPRVLREKESTSPVKSETTKTGQNPNNTTLDLGVIWPFKPKWMPLRGDSPAASSTNFSGNGPT